MQKRPTYEGDLAYFEPLKTLVECSSKWDDRSNKR